MEKSEILELFEVNLKQEQTLAELCKLTYINSIISEIRENIQGLNCEAMIVDGKKIFKMSGRRVLIHKSDIEMILLNDYHLKWHKISKDSSWYTLEIVED